VCPSSITAHVRRATTILISITCSARKETCA
jgi:hypothetical protein